MKLAWKLLKETFNEWLDDGAPRLGAALAFYSMLSLGPLLLLILSGATFLFGEDAARGQIMGKIDGLVGQQAAAAIQEVLAANAEHEETNWFVTIIGILTLLVGASGVFGQLQESLNAIWNVAPKRNGLGAWTLVKRRFFSFTMVLGTGFLLLISLVVSAVLAAVGEFSLGILPGAEAVWQLVNQVVGFAIITALFGVIFKYVPDVKIAWGHVWIGAAITAALFTVGKLAIGLYLGHSAFSSTYGAAGSLVVLLVWVYYSAQILFFGAEFTQVYSRHIETRRPKRPVTPTASKIYVPLRHDV